MGRLLANSSGRDPEGKFSIAKYGQKKAFDLAMAARRRALEGLQEPFNRSQAKRTQSRKGVKAASPSDPDLRIKRASVQRYRLRARDRRAAFVVSQAPQGKAGKAAKMGVKYGQ